MTSGSCSFLSSTSTSSAETGPSTPSHSNGTVVPSVRWTPDEPAHSARALIEAMKVCGHIEGIEFVQFDDRDVVRHKLVQAIVKAYEAYTPSVKHA